MNLPLVEYPSELPVSAFRENILAALTASQVVAVVGDTGSGKTTQLPKMVYEHFLSQGEQDVTIAITQPRRVAAYAVASRIADETQSTLGQHVGYAMRFDKKVSDDTCIKVATDGTILAEIASDPLLKAYNCIIIDEVHERSLNIDFLVGYLSRLVRRRLDLKIVLSSATLNPAPFLELFPNLDLLEVPGRLFPIEYRYETGERLAEFDVLELCKKNILELCKEGQGDVLVFLPTERDILDLQKDLEPQVGRSTRVLPLFGRLSSHRQREIFQKTPMRKVVLATNIAETSLTVPGIRYVVDSGLARISSYHPGSRTLRLPIVPVALSSLTQRAGRCGRTGPGVCVRIFEESDLEGRREYEKPEIARTNLAGAILQMQSYDLGPVEKFPFPEPPSQNLVAGAHRALNFLGALHNEKITRLGRRLARLPVDPGLGRVLLEAEKRKILPAMAAVVSGLTIADPRLFPKDEGDDPARLHRRFYHKDSDFLGVLLLWNYLHSEELTKLSNSGFRKRCKKEFLSYQRVREWRQLYFDLLRMFKVKQRDIGNISIDDCEKSLHKCLLTGALGKIGYRQKNGSYMFSGNKTARLQRLRSENRKFRNPDWVVVHELVEMKSTLARTVGRIDPRWIADIVPQVCKAKYGVPYWSEKTRRVQVTENLNLYGVTLKRKKRDAKKICRDEATQVFIRDYLLTTDDFEFCRENRRRVEAAEKLRDKTRMYLSVEPVEQLREHYTAKLSGVTSCQDLERFLEQNSEEVLLLNLDVESSVDVSKYPDVVGVDGNSYKVVYSYSPGEKNDGACLKVPCIELGSFPANSLPIPGLRESQVKELIRGLPKSVRKQLAPVDATVAELVNRMQENEWTLEGVRQRLAEITGLAIAKEDWSFDNLPYHLQVKVAAVDLKGNIIDVATDISTLGDIEAEAGIAESEFLKRYSAAEINPALLDSFPEKVKVGEYEGKDLFKFPCLEVTDLNLTVGLYSSREQAQSRTLVALQCSAKQELEPLVKKCCKQIRAAIIQSVGSQLVLEAVSAEARFQNELFDQPLAGPYNSESFKKLKELIQARSSGLMAEVGNIFSEIIPLKREVLSLINDDHLKQQFEQIFGTEQLSLFSLDELDRFPLYLQSWKVRLERIRLNKKFEKEVRMELAPYYEVVDSPKKLVMLEEYKLSTFTPKLRGMVKVGKKKLDITFGFR